MFILLKPKAETQKAFQLPNGAWIPKSILDSRGLINNYYKPKDWWLNKLIEQFTKDKSSKNTLEGLKEISILRIQDLPKEVKNHWNKYWKENYENSGYSHYDMEPRMWGNDCFEGSMSNYH